MPFNVTFFDGKSSKSHKATLTASSLNWKISYQTNEHQDTFVSWNVSKIKKGNVYTKGLVTFTYGDTFPFQRIESNDELFINYISTNEHQNINNRFDTVLHKSAPKTITALIAIIIAFSLGMYFYVIPKVATSFAANLNQQNVVHFGDYIFRVLSNDLEINNEQSKKLQDFLDKLNFESEFPIKAYVAKSDELNAFALSGGKIVVFSSLLEKIETEAQLAALIGHEISHIENRHILKSVSRNLSGTLFISILFGDINGVTTVLADNAHLFSQLSYSRDLEKEADLFGLELMKKNQLDLHGMPQLFQILKDETEIDVPTYLSNHPMLKDRIEYTKDIANKQNHEVVNKTLQEKWLLLKESLSTNETQINE